VIDAQRGREQDRLVAVLTNVRRRDVPDVFADRLDAVVAPHTVARDAGVIEAESRAPRERPVARVAIGRRRRVVGRLAERIHVVWHRTRVSSAIRPAAASWAASTTRRCERAASTRGLACASCHDGQTAAANRRTICRRRATARALTPTIRRWSRRLPAAFSITRARRSRGCQPTTRAQG
jgi:hypothetical protein